MKPLHKLLSVQLAGWAVSGAFAHAALGAVSTVVLARALDPAGLGVYGIFLAITILLGQLGDLGLGTAFVRMVTPVFQRRDDARPMYSTFFSLRLASVAVLGTIALVAGDLLGVGDEGRSVTLMIVGAGVVGGVLLTVANHHHEVLRARLKHKDSAFIRTAITGSRAAAYGAMWLAGSLTVQGAIAVAVGALVLEDIVVMWRAVRRAGLWPPARPTPRRDWLVISGWLFLTSGTGALMVHTDTLLIGWLGGSTETGWWVAGSRLIGPLPLVVGALWSVVLPVSVALDDPAKLARFLRLAWRGAMAVFVAALVGTLFVGPLMDLLFGSAYAGATATGKWLLVGHGANVTAMVYGGLILRLRLERELALVSVSQLAVNTAGDVLLIPAYGASGCAAVTAIVMIIGASWSIIRVTRARSQVLASGEKKQ